MMLLGLSNLEPFSGFTHDTSVALTENGKIIFASSEERFTKIKHYCGFPSFSLDWLSKSYGIDLEVTKIAVPWASVGEKESLVVTNNNNPSISRNQLFKRGKVPNQIIQIDHQLSHAASSFRLSGWSDSAIISLDGGGADAEGPTSGGVYIAKNNSIEKIITFDLYSNLGNFYGAITEALGWSYADGEGKTMGLASFGDSDLLYQKIQNIAPLIKGINMIQGKYMPPRYEIVNGRFCVEFSDKVFLYIQNLIQQWGQENVAAAAQKILEDRVSELIKNVVDFSNCKRICLGGGVFLNVKANKKILEEIKDINIYINPNPGDGGSAVGAALEAFYQMTGKCSNDKIESSYLGTSYPDELIESYLKINRDKIDYYRSADVAGEVAQFIANKQVIGWFQGRSEWGPRALGGRSVLADPTDEHIKNRINDLLKKREHFMPFAPSVLENFQDEYFINSINSPFMLFAFDVKEDKRKEIPAVIHIDGTSRIHTVNKSQNPLYSRVIAEYEKYSSIPMILNTSFNRHGLPLVETPLDAIQHLLWGCIDILAVGNFIVARK